MRRFSRFQNISLLVIGLFNLLFAIKVISQSIIQGEISITSHAKIIFGYFMLIFSAIGILYSIYLLIYKPLKIHQKIRKISLIIFAVFLGIYLFEFILFPIINSLIKVADLTRIPAKDQFLDSMMYIVIDYADDFLKGIFMTLELALLGTLIGLFLGLILVVFRIMKVHPQDSEIIAFLKKLGVFLSKLYVNVFRGTPMIVQAVIIYYLLPSVLSDWLNIPISEIDKVLTISVSGIIIVSLNTTAYLTEVLRGGIEAVDSGQLEASRSLGMSYYQSMVNIVFPQAIKNSLPAICNEFIINIKDTSVLNVIGVAELFFVTNEAQFKYYRTYEPFIIVAIIYFVLTFTTSKLLGLLERKLNLPAQELPSSN
ncbi:MAG: ABC transporter permease subunit [Bacilli bacterium]|nr:ABC transporter permease subunit [Bacilli bacterium]